MIGYKFWSFTTLNTEEGIQEFIGWLIAKGVCLECVIAALIALAGYCIKKIGEIFEEGVFVTVLGLIACLIFPFLAPGLAFYDLSQAGRDNLWDTRMNIINTLIQKIYQKLLDLAEERKR